MIISRFSAVTGDARQRRRDSHFARRMIAAARRLSCRRSAFAGAPPVDFRRLPAARFVDFGDHYLSITPFRFTAVAERAAEARASAMAAPRALRAPADTALGIFMLGLRTAKTRDYDTAHYFDSRHFAAARWSGRPSPDAAPRRVSAATAAEGI